MQNKKEQTMQPGGGGETIPGAKGGEGLCKCLNLQCISFSSGDEDGNRTLFIKQLR